MDGEELIKTARALTAPGKGILASDESTGTIGKRLAKEGLDNTESVRRAYRELLYTSNIEGAVSGAIMFKETLGQATAEGVPFVDFLKQKGVIPGIKVDEGLAMLEGTNGETSTRGLETLSERCKGFRKQGACFAKWRAVLKVGPGMPSDAAIEQNSRDLAKYAATCQANGLVPIVEPEVLIDGDHSIQQFSDASQQVFSACISQLWREGCLLEGVLLKPQMMINGADYQGPGHTPELVAEYTLRVLRRCIPPAIPGIMFLSGGQNEEEATVNLNAINKQAARDGCAPWSLSFSFGRALQASVLKIWADDHSNVDEAKAMAAALARVNGEAAKGQYVGPHPSIQKEGVYLRESFRGWQSGVGTA